jgi:hypothetical protein
VLPCSAVAFPLLALRLCGAAGLHRATLLPFSQTRLARRQAGRVRQTPPQYLKL